MGFLFSVNVYVFIPMVLFLQLKVVKDCQKWVYIGMGEIFFLEIFRDLSQNAAKYTSCVLKMCSPTNVPYVLMCLRANVICVLTCSRVYVLCVPTCLRAHVPTCLACLSAPVPTCIAYFHPHVLMCLSAYVLTCLRALGAYVPMCKRTILSNINSHIIQTC